MGGSGRGSLDLSVVQVVRMILDLAGSRAAAREQCRGAGLRSSGHSGRSKARRGKPPGSAL